tara:strand:- start:79 stop:1011 length:933 start_codon:yes stop_codon:yes gene_type:complete
MIKFLIIIYIFLFSSKSNAFSISEVAKGVYVHYGVHEDANEKNEGDIANLGFIVGEKSIMVIDTGGTQLIAKKLLNKIKEISNLPISHVVITHSHPDHFFGTEVFLNEKPLIVGHEKLNRSLLTNFEFYKNLQYSNIKLDIINNAKPVTADLLVEIKETKEIDLGDRIIEIKAWGSGHTDNDLSVLDKKTKVLWSENIFVTRVPSIRASILGWKKNLEEILEMDLELIVPGHGNAIPKNEAVMPMLNYFNRIINQLRDFIEKNVSLQESINKILQNEILNPEEVNKENWLLFTEYHYSNITKAYTELEWE